jgi:hypothetical protein
MVVRAAVFAERDARDATLMRAGRLDPYLAETLDDEVVSAGRESRLELAVVPESAGEEVTQLTALLARIHRRGVEVSIAWEPAAPPA